MKESFGHKNHTQQWLCEFISSLPEAEFDLLVDFWFSARAFCGHLFYCEQCSERLQQRVRRLVTSPKVSSPDSYRIHLVSPYHTSVLGGVQTVEPLEFRDGRFVNRSFEELEGMSPKEQNSLLLFIQVCFLALSDLEMLEGKCILSAMAEDSDWELLLGKPAMGELVQYHLLLCQDCRRVRNMPELSAVSVC